MIHKKQTPWPLFCLSFLTAGHGFLVEANLMQALSALFGGTILQYQLGVGLFVVSLGLGSFIYAPLSGWFSSRSLLLGSTLLLMLISLVAPQIFYRSMESGSDLSSLQWLYYLFLVLVGLVTGLDLPALIFWMEKKNHEATLLGLDYLGMFGACLVFPFLFTRWGIFSLSPLSVGLGLISIFLISLTKKRDFKKAELSQSFQWRESPFLILCFLIAFCSLCYELILVRWMVDFFENEVLAMTYSIGSFILGLALGSLTFREKKLTRQVLLVEGMIIISMLISPVVMFGIPMLWKIQLMNHVPLFFAQGILFCFVFLVGYWSGKELPLILSLHGNGNKGQISRLLFINYMGALLATLFIPLYSIPQWGLYPTILLVVSLNILSLMLFAFLAKVPFRAFVLSFSLIGLVGFTVPPQSLWWEQSFLKVFYHKLKIKEFSRASLENFNLVIQSLEDIQRIVTPYQNIDLVRTEIPYTGYAQDDLGLFLNHQPQFSLASHALYHDSFSHGALNLQKKIPHQVVIFGGGDGLLASRLAQIPEIRSIHLVELDQAMIDLARSYRRIRQANGDIFHSDRVQLTIGDAFQWLRENKKTYDAFFMDFPYPTNYELSRLYSLEFYKLVAHHLHPDGFMVINAPFSFPLEKKASQSLEPAQTLLSTIAQAGFKTQFPFGSIEPFLFAKKKKVHLSFDYDQLPLDFPNSSFVNLVPIKEIQLDRKTEKINSVFHPRRVVTW